MNQKKIEFRVVRDFGGILGVTFEYIKSNFKVLFKSNLLIASPLILLAGVFMGIYQSSIFRFTGQSTFQQIGVPFLFSMFFMMLSYFVITIVTYSHLIIYKRNETNEMDIGDVWQVTKSNFFMLLFTAIGYSVIIAIGFFLLIIPAIYFSVALSFIFIVRLEEGLGFIESVKRCFKIISGNWWFTLGLVLVVGIIQGFLGGILYMPTYMVMFFTAFAGVDAQTGSLARILYIISSIITSLSALLYTISTTAIAFQYYNLVERKEAPGLLMQIENIK